MQKKQRSLSLQKRPDTQPLNSITQHLCKWNFLQLETEKQQG